MKYLLLVAAFVTTSNLTKADDNTNAKKNTDTAKKTAKLPKYEVAWKINKGLKAPESIYFDSKSGFLFLSQIGEGGGNGKDGDGWISKISLDGKVIKDKWVTGFNSPKGLRSHSGTLYVSDIDRVVAIDIAQGEISKVYEFPYAKFLNDLATGPDGTVYVADMLASMIYQIKDGQASVFMKGDEIESPNGLLVHDGYLIIAGWGQQIQDDFSTKKLGRLLSVDISSKTIIPITEEPTGNLDGVEADGRGGYFVTDWIAGKVFRISKKGRVRQIMQTPKGAADHAYLVDKGLLILPEMLENTLTAYRVSTSRKKKSKDRK